MLMEAAKSSLLLIDVQERLLPAMAGGDEVVRRCSMLLKAAKQLDVPVTVSEQYPKGLGPTMKVVSERIPDFKPIEKLEFSAFVPEVKERLTGRSSVLVTGMETHVCVFQTVRALGDAKLTAYLAADAVLSRTEVDERVGLELCRNAGAMITTVETVLFDALGKAGGPEFKAISAAVK